MNRRWIASPLCRLALAVVLSVATFGAEAMAGRLFVFGDSYSAGNRRPFPNWVEQLKAAGKVSGVYNYAVSGATASSSSGKTFFQQVNRWRQGGPAFRSGDTTVIYLGYNDIDDFSSFTGSRNGYQAGLRTLISGGANQSGRRIVLVLPHDWGATPQFTSSSARSRYRSKTRSWNQIVRGLRSSGANIVTVDLFALLDKVVANPGSYGLNNVTRADPSKSKTTALYDDPAHFGQKGQSIIRQAIGKAVL